MERDAKTDQGSLLLLSEKLTSSILLKVLWSDLSILAKRVGYWASGPLLSLLAGLNNWQALSDRLMQICLMDLCTLYKRF